MPKVFAHMLPTFLTGIPLENSTAVVIDVLRASTTMVHALGHGAQAIVPCLTVESALVAAQSYPPDTRLLGGERHGMLIPGFDLGNSPLDYTPAAVQGKTVIFTTTNGTRALLECKSAARVCVGAFVNRQAITAAVSTWEEDVHLVCAGTDGQLTAEDILFAGAVAGDLLTAAETPWTVGNVQAQMAQDFFQARSRTPELFRQCFFASLGAQNLVNLGMTKDIERAMGHDLFSCVPQWDAITGKITISD